MDTELQLLYPEEFPALLAEIRDRPKELYVRGTLPKGDLKYLAVVGSRACTEYGRRALRYLIEGLRGYPIVIVSGLAYGIDAEAHLAALDAGLATIGVPGSGLDWNVLYPRANVRLAREILAAGSALISEFDPEQKAADYTFPQRNRIMAGMSHATLIIEAKEKSGTLITAKLAVEYNRDLLAVPGSIFAAESAGVHQFLRLGATPATRPEDILAVLGIAERADAASWAELRDLSESERSVVGLLASPRPRDELIDALALPITDANVLLSAMELKGLIIEELGVVRVQ